MNILQLPSKKLAPILIACVIAVAGIVTVVVYTPKNKVSQKDERRLALLAETDLNLAVNTKDTDGDTLPDWEEGLIGTDPQKTDTDGDGTQDGQEVKTGRNPLVKGPNDKVDTSVKKVATASTTVTSKSQTATDAFALDLFSKYMSIKQAGGTISPEIQEQLAQSVVSQTTFGVSEAKVYSRTNLIITTDTADSLHAYGNKMGEILMKNSIKNSKNELLIVENAFNNQSKTEIAQLDVVIAAYQKMVKEFLATPVPSTAVSLHVNILNNFSKLVEVDQGLRKLFTDPVITLAALQRYQEIAAETGTIFTAVKIYFDSQQVKFSPGEPGYNFVHVMG